MQLVKKRSLNIFLAFTLLLSIILPSLTFAEQEKSPVIKGNADDPKLTIHKYEQEPDAEEGEKGTGLPGQEAEGDPVEGVTFELTQTHKYNAETDKWEEVTDGETIEGTTGENGTIVFDKNSDPALELGRYTVKETDGPDHVILNPEEFSVDIPMTSKEGTTLNYDVHIYPKNEIIRGDAELIKKDEDGEALPGVTFGLYDSEGKKIEKLVTDSQGKISVEGLDQGKYYFQEIETVEGHAINEEKIHFEVVAGEQGKVDWTSVDGFVNENGEVINYKVPEIEKDVEEKKEHKVDRDEEFVYNITITTPKDIDKYKTLGVTDTLDHRLEFVKNGSIEEGWEVTGTERDNIQFDEQGQTLIWSVKDLSQLEPGKEIKITFTAKIKPDAKLEPAENGIPNEAELEFDNDRGEFTDPEDPPTTPPVIVTPKEGGLKVIKVDKSDNDLRLEGAEFKLTTDQDGNDVVDAEGTIITVNGESHNGLLENLATNNEGEILIEGLTPGTYYLHETKAPTYEDEDGNEKSYRLLTKPLKVEVSDNVENEEVTVENSKSGWELPTTGGIGTVLFTIVGLALMAVALIAFLRRKREVTE